MSGTITKIHEDISALDKKITILLTESDEYLNISDTASFLGLSKSRVYKITHKKEIPFSKIGKIVRFKKSDLIFWLNSSRIQAA